MVSLTNGLGTSGVVATWFTENSYPYNSETYDDSVINGTPYVHYIGGDAFYFDNEFVNPPP